MVDKNTIMKRFSKAMPTYQSAARIQEKCADRLMEMLSALPEGLLRCGKVLEVGCGTGMLSRKFLEKYKPAMLWLNDLCPSSPLSLNDILSDDVSFMPGDAEAIDFPVALDAIISSSTLQWFNDIPSFVRKCKDSLSEGGVLAFSTFGPGTLREVESIEGVGLDYISTERWRRILEDDFEILAIGEDTIVETLPNPLAVLRYFKDTGVSGVRSEAWTKGRMLKFVGEYARRYSSGEGVTMTWHPVWVIAVKKTCAKDNVFFVSGIDTNVGKSYATGWLASKWNSEGVRTITQKLVQTGNEGRSEDIELHRKIMGLPLLPEDLDGTTMPEIYTYPCSPHLAAEIDGRPVDFEKIEAATAVLSAKYDAVLLEGAGGLMVPLTRSLLTIDYVKSKGFPVILVTSGRLGSISHTLLSIEALHIRGMRLKSLIYNNYPHCEDSTIEDDTREYLKVAIGRFFPDAEFIEVPLINF